MKQLWRKGESFIWLTGGALAISLLMVTGLLTLVLINGLGFFWPKEMVRLTLQDGRMIMGPVMAREPIPQPDAPPGTPLQYRIQVKQGNRDLYGIDFVWVDEADIVSRDIPLDAIVIERTEWGNFHGFIQALQEEDRIVAEGADAAWAAFQVQFDEVEQVLAQIYDIEKDKIGDINYAQEEIRLRIRSLEMDGVTDSPQVEALRQEMEDWQSRYRIYADAVVRLRQSLTSSLILSGPGGEEKALRLEDIIRVYHPNDMGAPGKTGFYIGKLWEFVWADPRESNTEGGVFPAIFGTVMMVIIMSVVVTPLGILAAFYLREYASQGAFVSTVRIAVNNLAGVPSIVFGVFGVGFFIYFVGGGIDRLFYPEQLPAPTYGTGGILWASLTLALLTVPVVIVATEEGLAAIPMGIREASLALGATKFETTWRVVLPAVLPSIMTGLILAMARAAGEVAPLMITGVVKLAPTLPVDGYWPFIHLDRKFMHLGFHIYDVGFQSPNVDAARPMVYTTTMLLLMIVVALNLTAITLRSRLRKKYSVSSV